VSKDCGWRTVLIKNRQGIRGYLEASKKGKPVYEKLGFRVVREIVFQWEGEVLDVNCVRYSYANAGLN
jgi:hypothetical protein